MSKVKIKFSKRFIPVAAVVAAILGQPAMAYAYVGPGAGLSIIGSLLSFLAAIVIGIFGFLWFPIRRLLRRRKQVAAQKAEETARVSEGTMREQDEDEVTKGEGDT